MIRIVNDTFDIAWRIKSIDERYELFYNRRAKRYEVYAYGIRQAIIPYDSLDIRTIKYLRKTRRENIEKLLAEIDRDNKKLEKEREYEIKKRAENRIEEVMRWS